MHTSPRTRSILGHRDHFCVGNTMMSSRGEREEREEEDGVLQVLLQEFVRHGLDEPFYEACSCADRKAGHAWFAKHQERWGRAMLSTAKVCDPASVPAPSHTHTHTHTHALTHSLSHSLTHLLSHSLTLSLILSLTRSLTHSLTYTHNTRA